MDKQKELGLSNLPNIGERALVQSSGESSIMAVVRQFDNLKKLAAIYHNSGCNPGQNATVDTALIKLIKGVELSIGSKTAMDLIYIINNRATMEGKLMAALILRAGGKYEVLESDARIAKVKFSRRGYEDHIAEFTIEEAKIAQLTNKENWMKYPKRMLFWRAFSMGANVLFADVIHGMLLPEELDGDIEDVEPIVILDPKVQEELTELMNKLPEENKDGLNKVIEKIGGIEYLSTAQAQEYIKNIKQILTEEGESNEQ